MASEMSADQADLSTSAKGVREFEREFGPQLEALVKTLERAGKLKRVGQQVELMNLVDLRKQLDDVVRLGDDLQMAARSLQTQLASFRIAPAAEQQAEWMERFRQAFTPGYPPLEGAFPTLKMFPVEVRVDFEHELVLVNNRTVRTLHPEAVAKRVMRTLDRLNNERFNAVPFARALLRIYDLLMYEAKDKGKGTAPGRGVPLQSVYELLSARVGASGYSKSQFAFDIYRLRRTPELVVEGRRLVFASSRNRGAVVITEPNGHTDSFGALEVVEDRGDHEGE